MFIHTLDTFEIDRGNSRRLKRSGSQDFHERERTDEFKRGGIRATATARLGWSKDIKKDL